MVVGIRLWEEVKLMNMDDRCRYPMNNGCLVLLDLRL